MGLRQIDWLAERLGVTKHRAYDLVRSGVVPAVRLGRQVRVEESTLERWIASGGTNSQAAGVGRLPADSNR